MGKGEVTRDRILQSATALASRVGFDGLTIGALAEELSMSKSGLFAHFGSKEELQLRVLESEVARWEQEVFHAALKHARGVPRIKALFEAWLKWNGNSPYKGGCLIISGSVEFDDQPGALRESVKDAQKRLLDAMARSARIAVEVGHFKKDADVDQFAFDLYGVILSHHFIQRLQNDRGSVARARAAFQRLIEANSP